MFRDKEDAQRRARPRRDRRRQDRDRRGLTNAGWIFGLRLPRREWESKKWTCDQRPYHRDRSEPARCNHLIPLPGKVPLPRTIQQNHWLNNGKMPRPKLPPSMKYSGGERSPYAHWMPAEAATMAIQSAEKFCSTGNARSV